ncbi:MAG: lipase maturation factor family protein [Kiritimatiellae bacterium]|nr:lipase maturation factor family protein [Kiritimatiellia bacterium]MCO5045301.1 lipase maturation factor family protein [Kiritimatiellia bacterium]MCO5060502.1 lipase maturation factor family protein [Kiritimatiellia bacterium]
MISRWVNSIRGYGTGYAWANQLGLRALGVVYFIAFTSYLVQADGLIGVNGVLPFAEWLAAIRPRVEILGFHHMPTLLWLWPNDAGLHTALWIGIVCSVLLVLGFAPLFSTSALWALYLSVTLVGRTFFSFQWDSLLTEAGLLAILASPWRWRMRWRAPDAPSRVAVFLFHFLAFKLMFLSGWAKLASGDPTWRDLTALTYHYWTQPLPLSSAWYAHLLPLWFQKLSCLLMLVVELVFPFLIALGARLRTVAAVGFIALMALIAATGNFAFFNLLTATLCFWLIRDTAWASFFSFCGFRRLARLSEAGAPVRAPVRFSRAWVWAPGLAIAMLSLVYTLRFPIPWPRFVERAVVAVAPFRSVNGYGLFATMTKTRPEIIIEGSWDGQKWFPYEFRWKPGDPLARPRWVAPHQPRLDWQMWFAALGTKESNPWVLNLMVRLLQNEPTVLELLLYNPFEQRPPVHIRAVRYEYRFSTPAEREATGAWWVGTVKDLYCPPFQLHATP